MTKAGRPDETRRAMQLLNVFEYLRQRGLFDGSPFDAVKSIPVSDVASHFGYTEDDVVRIAEELACCGQSYLLVPLIVDQDAGLLISSHYDVPRLPLRLSPAECRALLKALEIVGMDKDSPLVRELVDKMAAPTADESTVSSIGIPQPYGETAEIAQTVSAVASCIESSHVMHFCYRKPNATETSQRMVEPLTLLLDQGHLYLSAYSPADEDVRTFSVERISDARSGDETFTPREVFAKRFSEQLEHDLPQATLRFAADFTLEPREWPGIHILQTDGDGSVLAHIPFTGSDWLPTRVAAQQGAVEILEPEQLRQDVCRVASQHLLAAEAAMKVAVNR